MRGFTKLKKKHLLKISAVYLIGNPEIWGVAGAKMIRPFWPEKNELNTILKLLQVNNSKKVCFVFLFNINFECFVAETFYLIFDQCPLSLDCSKIYGSRCMVLMDWKVKTVIQKIFYRSLFSPSKPCTLSRWRLRSKF